MVRGCQALRSTFERWIDAYARRDLAGTMSIFADDVIFSFQGSPDSNKPDLEKSYREEFAHPEESRIWLPEFEEFECSGDLGFIRSTWKLEVKTPDGKVEVKAENRSIDILRRSPDGEWKIFRSLNYPLTRKPK
ncbi:MAG: hypothetical protein DMF37_04255 [Verrucomicrobia bacterium]|nr:MAG: hypothetical protein DMF37_04255 [Verrucomicrobiota bacterium]